MSTIGPNYRDFIEGIVLNPVIEANDPPNTRIQDESIPIVYGLQRILPPIMWYRLSDYDTKSLIVTYALSEGPCFGIYRLFLEDLYVQTDQTMALVEDPSFAMGTANTIRVPLSGPYLGVAEFEFMSGREYDLNLISPGSYESKILKGNIANTSDRPQYPNELCYLVVKYTWNDDGTSPYRDIPKLTVDLFGKQVADTAPNSSVRKFSTNPAKHLWDYMTNTRFGGGFNTNVLDTASFQAGVTYFDANTDVFLSNGQKSVTKRLTSNVVIRANTSVRNNIDSMLSTNFMYIPFIDGKFILDIEKTDASEIDFTENSLIGEVKVSYPDTSSKYNSIVYTFLDAERDFIKTTRRYPESDAAVAVFVTQDNNFVNTVNLEFASITDPYMAERQARQYLEKSRKQAKFTFSVFKDAWKYKVGDVCRIKTLVPDLDYVEVRIISMAFLESNIVDIEAYGHDDTWYVPFVDFYQTPVDYKKPLIPTSGGVLLPSNPTQPISVIPPVTGNPGAGDPGHPGQPNPAPINPVQPGEPLPPIPPAQPTYLLNNTTVQNGASIPTLGNQNQYYVGWINASTGAFEYELDQRYIGSSQNAQLRYQGSSATARRGYYELFPVLTHRNLDNTEIGYVYEILPGKFGFPVDRGEYIYLWDPEKPSTKVTQYNTIQEWLSVEKQFSDIPVAGAIPRMNLNPSQGVWTQSRNGIVFGTHSGVFKYATASGYLKGGANYRWGLPNLHGNFSGEVLTMKVKFFTLRNKNPTGFLPEFIKYIGEYTYTISNSLLTNYYIDLSRQNYANCAPFQTAPF